MTDWKGLLEWTLKYNDGTKPSEFKPLSEEDRKFIEDAFESVTINEMKEIWKILDMIKEREKDDEKSIEERCNLLEALSDYIDGPENARNIIRGKRFNEIINYFFETKHKEVKIILGRILTQMMQNDGYIQKEAMNLGLFKYLDNLNTETDKDLVTNYIYILTGLIYGNETSVRNFFIKDLNGIPLLYNLLLKQRNIQKNFKRVLNILNDLTKIVDEQGNKDMYLSRKNALSIIKSLHINTFLCEMLCDYSYDNDNSLDAIHLIFGLISNLAEIFDSFDDISKTLKNMNDKIPQSQFLNDTQKKEEKKYLIDILKVCKENIKLSKKDFVESQSGETLTNGNKESTLINLKK